MKIEEKTILWKPVSEYTGGRVLATNGLDILIGELNPEGYCVSEDCSGTHLCGITHFAKIDGFFPTLRESEDEKIRKALIKSFEIHDLRALIIPGFSAKDVIAWLEKQGEQKPTLPKWKYKKDNTPLLRDSIILNKYGCVAKSPSGSLVSDVWVIDYDELAKLPKEEIEKQDEQKPYGQRKECEDCQFSYVGECKGDCALKRNEQKSADKIEDEEYNGEDYGIDSLFHAQRILEKTLGKVDGYQTDDGILAHQCAISAVKKLYEQKTSKWSEKDERMWKSALWHIKNSCSNGGKNSGEFEVYNWLKSLKDRLRPKQEWSEEDEVKRNALIGLVKEIKNQPLKRLEDWDGYISWLKSLKPQPKQAWSEEDEDYYDAIITKLEVTKDDALLTNNQMEFLKLLKDKIQIKQEWSEEDEKIFGSFMHKLEVCDLLSNKEIRWAKRWLKSLKPQNNITDEELAQAKKDAYNDALGKIEYHSGEPTFDDGWSAAIDYIRKKSFKPQNHWKPTEAQLASLTIACDRNDRIGFDLTELLKELKKL